MTSPASGQRQRQRGDRLSIPEIEVDLYDRREVQIIGRRLELVPRGAPGCQGGRVALVGAGPGDPELITVRGLNRLRSADVVLYDRLVDLSLLDEVREGCLLIDVGKRPGAQAHTQEQIHALLVEHARRGSRVVRLKGGDPFVFGRGAEEAMACAAFGVPCEVVPGLSSALAAPAAIGIPLTHRGKAASFAVLSGHRAEDGELDLDAAPGIDTLVVLMAAGNLEHVCERLIAAGRSPATPAAIVERATWAEQRSVRGTLASLPRLAEAAAIHSPAALIVGEVVALDLGLTEQEILTAQEGGLR